MSTCSSNDTSWPIEFQVACGKKPVRDFCLQFYRFAFAHCQGELGFQSLTDYKQRLGFNKAQMRIIIKVIMMMTHDDDDYPQGPHPC